MWFVVAFEATALDATQKDQLGAESLRLPTGEPRQLGAPDSFREAEEVLDHGRVRRLAPGHIPVAHDRRQAVGGRVDRGGEAGRPRADDRKVVVRLLRRLQATPGQGDRLDGRRSKGPVAVDEDRQGRINEPKAREQEVRLGRIRLVPLVRLRGAREEIAETVMLCVHPPTHDLHRWAYRAHAVDSSAALQGYAAQRQQSLVEACGRLVWA